MTFANKCIVLHQPCCSGLSGSLTSNANNCFYRQVLAGIRLGNKYATLGSVSCVKCIFICSHVFVCGKVNVVLESCQPLYVFTGQENDAEHTLMPCHSVVVAIICDDV